MPPKYDDQVLLQQFAEIVKKHKVIDSGDYDSLKVDKPARETLRKRFGSWKASLEAANLHISGAAVSFATHCEAAEPVPEDHPEVRVLRQQVE